jgi:hypothetical protein
MAHVPTFLKRISWPIWCLAASSVVAAGCHPAALNGEVARSPVPVATPEEGGAIVLRSECEGVRGENPDEYFARLARLAPGFGGWYVDTDRALTVIFRRDSDPEETIGCIAAGLVSEGLVASADGLRELVRFRRDADYDYAELYQWRMDLRALFGTQRVTGLGVDVIANRVRVGVQHSSDLESVREKIMEFGVPLDAVRVQVERPPPPAGPPGGDG